MEHHMYTTSARKHFWAQVKVQVNPVQVFFAVCFLYIVAFLGLGLSKWKNCPKLFIYQSTNSY